MHIATAKNARRTYTAKQIQVERRRLVIMENGFRMYMQRREIVIAVRNRFLIPTDIERRGNPTLTSRSAYGSRNRPRNLNAPMAGVGVSANSPMSGEGAGIRPPAPPMYLRVL